jgi:hypothetical protein
MASISGNSTGGHRANLGVVYKSWEGWLAILGLIIVWFLVRYYLGELPGAYVAGFEAAFTPLVIIRIAMWKNGYTLSWAPVTRRARPGRVRVDID